MIRRWCVGGAILLGLLAFTGTAGAANLGLSLVPDVLGGHCSGFVMAQYSDDPSLPYIVPAGGGTITQWQTDTLGDQAGSSLTFAVLRPTGTGYQVVGTDTETLPDSLPANNVVVFNLAVPIQAAAGDTLALYAGASDVCYYADTYADSFIPETGTLPPAAGETLTPAGSAISGYVLDVGATLVTEEDAGVKEPPLASVAVGHNAVLASDVSNGGPESGPITFVDQVPGGLQIHSAVAGMGTCAFSGQTVTCTISGLAAGQSATVDVVVTGRAPGTYTNRVSVATTPGITDQNPANNSASATLQITALPKQCAVPAIHKLPLAAARRLVTQLGCRVRLVHVHSRVRAGLVIGVRGGVHSYPFHHVVTLIVSSGRRRG